ncbi:MAG: hypothetical protein CVV49_06130 [Spirochaetae bacterium HGW-Spirochaetae-5]|nr:MAG: hypothetical protein CVV49_06130 [Spirochaetae bacterium HGW-Spirochaetae-5]
MKFRFGEFLEMPDNGIKKLFFFSARFSELMIELISDETSLLKIDFVNGNKIKLNTEISEPVKRALTFFDDYFSGRRSSIDICLDKSGDGIFKNDSGKLYLNMSDYTDKEIEIYRNLLNVKPGKTLSYSELASVSGITGGARFAGNCMARNRFPVIIPCHRVVKKDGSMGNYTGGVWIKELLLKHELNYKWC